MNGMRLRVIVCGGRNFRSPAQIFRELDRIHAEMPISEMMHGGCPTGVDKFASEWVSTKREIQGYVCRADWGQYGRAAGPIRNARMLEWKPDRVIAFPGGRGTANMIKLARAAGVHVDLALLSEESA